MMNSTLSILFIIVIFYKHVYGYMRVCYYTNWSQYRPNGAKFTPDDIDPTLCSHIVYAFGKLEGNILIPFEWNDDSTEWSIGMYAKVNNFKKTNPQLRTLLAIGGWNAGSPPFSEMARTGASRREFVNSTLHFLRDRNFDGLDMDWEYPSLRGGRPDDKANLVLLLDELRKAFEQESYHTGLPRLLLTAAVPAGKSNVDAGYDIPNVAKNLDFINIMTYDLHGSWDSTTGHNSPLYGRANEVPVDSTLNMDWAVRYWLKNGAPKHKLIVGIGLYGRSFKLQVAANNGMGVPVIGAGKAGKYTREPGFMSYYEVCEELQTGATRVWQTEHKAPYAYKDDLWVGYDDEESVREKVRWMKQNKFGGIMIWSLALDDFNGKFCNRGPYPLLTTINEELGVKQPRRLRAQLSPLLPPTAIDRTGLNPTPVSPTGFNTLPTSPPKTFLADIQKLISLAGPIIPDTVQAAPTNVRGEMQVSVPPPILIGNTGISGQSAATPVAPNLPIILSDPGNRASVSSQLVPPIRSRQDRSHNSQISRFAAPPPGITNQFQDNINVPNSLPSVPLRLAHDHPPQIVPISSMPVHGHSPVGAGVMHHARPGPPVVPDAMNHAQTAPPIGPDVMHHLPPVPAVGPDVMHHAQPVPPVGSSIMHHAQPFPDIGPGIMHHAQPVPDIGSGIMHHAQPVPAIGSGIMHHAQPVPDVPIVLNQGPQSFGVVPHSPVMMAADTPRADAIHAGIISATGQVAPVVPVPPGSNVEVSIGTPSMGNPFGVVDSSGILGAVVPSGTQVVGQIGSGGTISGIQLDKVRPAPRSNSGVNFSFSSSSNSSSSSSSSKSESKSSSVNVGAGNPAVAATLQELLQHHNPISSSSSSASSSSSGSDHNARHDPRHHPIPVSVIKNPSDISIPPGSRVEAVIPINSIDNLAEVLASLGTSVPSSNSVIVPSENALNTGQLMRELDLANLLGIDSNNINAINVVAAPQASSPIIQAPREIPRSRQVFRSPVFDQQPTARRAPTTPRGLAQQRLRQQLQNQNLLRQRTRRPTVDRQALVAEIRARRLAALRARQQASRRQQQRQPIDLNQLSGTQLRRLLNRLDGATLQRLINSGRITLSPNVERPRTVSNPMRSRARTQDLRASRSGITGLNRRFRLPTTGRTTSNSNNRFSANVFQPQGGTGRRVAFINNITPSSNRIGTRRTRDNTRNRFPFLTL